MKEIYSELKGILNTKQKIQVFIIFILSLIGGILETLSISLIIPYIGIIIEPTILLEKSWGKVFLNIFDGYSYNKILIILTLILMFMFIFKNVYLYMLNIFERKFVITNYYECSNKLFNIYLRKPYSYFIKHNVSEIVAIITDYVTKCFVLIQNILMMCVEVVVLILLLLMMLLMNWKVTIAVFIAVSTLIIVLRKIIEPIEKKLGVQSNEQYVKMLKAVYQAFDGIKEIKAMNREEQFLDVYKEDGLENIKLEVKRTRYSAISYRIIETFTIMLILVYILVVLLSKGNLLTIFTELTSMGLIIIRVTPCMNRINMYLGKIAYYRPTLSKISDETIEYMNSKETESQKSVKRIPFNKSIKFENVTFRYPNTDVDILKNVSFEIKKGEKVGIIGKSGIGKTTLVDLLLGYWEVNSGKITIDGKNINDNIQGWLKHIGYIPQNIYMIDGTIYENVTFGLKDIPEEKVNLVLKKAKLDTFVNSLPDGLNTLIGEKGLRLSGGQRQRIGIARSLLSNPDILVLDEATSSLDTDLETEITDSIYEISDNKTVIMIAHRHSTLRECDYIIEVKNKGINILKTKDVVKK